MMFGKVPESRKKYSEVKMSKGPVMLRGALVGGILTIL
jgi:hypothetical protein